MTGRLLNTPTSRTWIRSYHNKGMQIQLLVTNLAVRYLREARRDPSIDYRHVPHAHSPAP